MPATAFEATKEFAAAQTARDPLGDFRERFHIPKLANGSDCVYLCGHSLGLQPKSTRKYVEQEFRRLGPTRRRSPFSGAESVDAVPRDSQRRRFAV